jgi:VWFA-related protein
VTHHPTRAAGPTLALIALATTLCLAQAGTAQQTPPSQQPPPPTQQQPPVFRGGTNFVRVDVYPLRDGKPVDGLKLEDFDVQEDGVTQKVEAFEHVVIRSAGPQETRREPSSQRESLQQATNPRSRVFVIFLDTTHVSVDGSHRLKEPLIQLMERIVGPEDLVGIMTPEMAASQVVLARKTQVIEDSLRTNWIWGRRFSLMKDEREMAYEACYPLTESEIKQGLPRSVLADKLIRRKQERATLEALEDLVRYLHAIREERKAIIAVSEGWLLYREDRDLMTLRKDGEWQEPIPKTDPIVVGPTGQPVTKDPRNIDHRALSQNECDTDRFRLATMDNDQFFRDIMGEANRGNSTFYPIDPRGLAVFDTPIGPKEESLPPLMDAASLRTRQESLINMATSTDGLAVMNSNDLNAGVKRIADDLTSYYLLGYYSTNAKLDGRFRNIRVRIKQPGVNVRARRGYRAASVDEVAAAKKAAEPPASGTPASAMGAALGTLGRIRPDARFRINATALGSGSGATIWIAGETYPQPGEGTNLTGGSTADIEVRSGSATQTTTVTLKPGEKTFLTTVTMPSITEKTVDVRARLKSDGAVTPATDAIQTEVGAAAVQPLAFRRGPSTGNRYMPAADFRFNRTERVRLEIPVNADAKPGAGRLLDRNGLALQLPVTVAERTDTASGQRWVTADLALAALAAGDYVIEVSTSQGGTESKLLTGIRVGR